MSTPDAQPAAPSAAPVSPSFTDFESAANAADVERRRLPRTGDVPQSAPKPSTPPADSSPAAPGTQASTDVTPDSSSDPTKKADPSPAPTEKRPDPRATENRIPELLADRARERERGDRLERELADLRRQVAQPKPDDKAAPSPAAAPETFPSYDAWLEKHPDGAYETYLDERSDFRVQQGVEKALKARDDATQQEQARRTFSQHVIERTEQFVQRIKDATAADPEFWNGISPEVKALKPMDDIRDPVTGQWTEQPTPYHWITQRVIESPDAAKYLKHFSDHPEDLHRIAKLHPDSALEALVELRVGWKHKPAAPPTKHVTDAPNPPPSLGRRPTAPTDALAAAVESGNYSAYEAAANARDLAARR